MTASTSYAAGAGRATFAALLLALAALTAYRLAARALAGVELYFDEAQYYAWSLAPDFGYFSKPPLVAWTIAAAPVVCGGAAACADAVPKPERAGSSLIGVGGAPWTVEAPARYRVRALRRGCAVSKQHDVVLLLMVSGFHLQTNRAADEIRQHRQ